MRVSEYLKLLRAEKRALQQRLTGIEIPQVVPTGGDDYDVSGIAIASDAIGHSRGLDSRIRVLNEKIVILEQQNPTYLVECADCGDLVSDERLRTTTTCSTKILCFACAGKRANSGDSAARLRLSSPRRM